MTRTAKRRYLTVLGPVSVSLGMLVVAICIQPAVSAAQTPPAQPPSAPSQPSAPETAPSPAPAVRSHPEAETVLRELPLVPDEAPAPERPGALLRRYVPGLGESLEKLP